LHRPLKAALTAHNNLQWTKSLPTVLLALRSIVKPELGCSPAEMVYGTTLRLPGEFFHAVQPEPQAPDLIRVLRESMPLLRPTPGTDHSKHSIFVSEELQTATHVFLRVDSTRKSLQPRYDGPFAMLNSNNKNLKLQLHNRTSWKVIDRLSPAILLRKDPVADHSYASIHVESQTLSTPPHHEVSTTEHSHNSTCIVSKLQPVLRNPKTGHPKNKFISFCQERGSVAVNSPQQALPT